MNVRKFKTQVMKVHFKAEEDRGVVREKLERAPSIKGLLNWDPGMHASITHNGRRRCSVCLMSTGNELRITGCDYNVLALGHRLWSLDSLIFCIRCGIYNEGRVGNSIQYVQENQTQPTLRGQDGS